MTGPSRDRAIERLLAVPAGRPSADVTGPCVEPEAVAAWLDGGLAAPAAEQFEAHVAACASCQELLATVVRMTPLEAPALQAVPRRPWTTWALPLAAAAVLVLAVWTTWPGSSGPAAPAVLKEESRTARAETPAPAAVPEPLAAAPPAVTGTETARRPAAAPAGNRTEQPRSFAAPPPAQSAASAADSREREAAQAAAPPARQAAKAESADLDKRVEQKAAPSAPAAAASVAATAAPRTDAPAEAGAGESRARRAGNLNALAGAAQALRDDGATRVAVQAPGARWRWRANRALEYSSDGGTTWRPSTGATAAQAADILAGASPGPQTVWLVGRRGLVLAAIDGMRFDLRASPAPMDLIAVQPTDHLTAIVRAATGESWRTVDGGRTWVALPR